MTNNSRLWLKIIGFGILVWIVPFVTGFFFVDQAGNFTIDIFIAKSIFMIIGAIVGAFLIYRLFKQINENYLRWGITIGLVWMITNWLLDIIILLPLSGDSITQWFGAIGVRYLSILITGILVGSIAQHFANRN